MPPGGPEDLDPPRIVAVSPESGSVSPRLKEVVFRFDEVISETPRTGTDLRSAVIVSPRDGDPNVSWEHDAISVRPRRGWRDSTTYVVTLLPGVTDLEGNVRDSTSVVVFSTGGPIPNTRLTGVAFDWIRNTPAPRTFIEAFPGADTTVRFVAESDSSGRFSLPFMRPGSYLIRALIDSDRNKTINPRESWDTVTVQLRDSVGVDMYLYPQDTVGSLGPGISGLVIVDSMTLRVTFDKPVTTRPGYTPDVRVQTRDSVPVPVRRIIPWTVIGAERELRANRVRDSIADADTSATRRAQRARARTDSINRAAILADSLSRMPARPPAPKPARPPLVVEYGIELQTPLAPGSAYRVYATVAGMSGAERTSQRDVSVPRRETPDTTGGRGSGRGSFRR